MDPGTSLPSGSTSADQDAARDQGGAPVPIAEDLPPISPDGIEQDYPEEMDNMVPTHGYQMLPLVGLGGSAGSIPALQRFFKAMPVETGMSFVVILHLAPEHSSMLDSILGNATTMRVLQPQDGELIEANTVYVIPPGKFLTASQGHLKLTDLEPEHGKRIAVDFFFRTLADTHGPHAAAIILSGADGDGALGIKRVKERGGLTIAQDPDEAEHSSMPRTAIATGMVDWVLPVEEMPPRLVEYHANEARLCLPSERGPQPAKAPPAQFDADENALREILLYLRSRTGRDFSYYKRATVVRRISRRMQVNGMPTVPEYLSFLRLHPGEAGALQQDLLISVTNFFRDRDAFASLEAQIPQLFAGKGTADAVRVWTIACATGEEAYSVAMLLLEYAGTLDSPPVVQVFATDLATDAITAAREGLFPFASAADLSEERLRRFFIREQGGFRARRELRESLLFAVHDVLKDAPFSRMDLITCRNLLIYLTPEAQARAFDVMHFALRSGGMLFLGCSETSSEDSSLFAPIDKKYRLYRQIPSRQVSLPLPIRQGAAARAIAVRESPPGGPFVHGKAFTGRAGEPELRSAGENEGARVSWEELHFRLLEPFAPPSIIVTYHYDIVHVSQNAGRFLHFSAGEPSVNLLQVIHPMLRVELRAALFRAIETESPAEMAQVPVELDGTSLSVNLRVSPAGEVSREYLLVVLEVEEAVERHAVQDRAEAEPAMRQLERELEQMRRRWRETVEQYEASVEELKAGNEELQAMNEELRSSSEELETSREELESINEELSTVNLELKGKVDELAHTNSDLANLMSATGVATIFLDRTLCITRYTPSAVGLFRLLPGDLGRPLSDLTHGLDYPELKPDAERVLASLIPIKREVSDGASWFLAQLLPYRTADDRIAGVVLSFVDISETRRAREALIASEERLRLTIDAGQIGTCDWNYPTGQMRGNRKRFQMFGIDPPELCMHAQELLRRLHPEDRERVWQELIEGVEQRGEHSEEYRVVWPNGAIHWIIEQGRVVEWQDGKPLRISSVLFDITERKTVEEAWRTSQEQLRLVMENARDYAIFSMDLDRYVRSWNAGARAILGYTDEEALGQSGDIIFTAEDREAGAPEAEAAQALREGRAADERWHVRKDGSRFWGSGAMMVMRNEPGEAIGLLKIFRDETKQLQTKEALEMSREKLWAALQETEQARSDAEAAAQAKDHFLAVLSHELRTPLTPVLMAVRTLGRLEDLPPLVRTSLEMIQRNVLLEAHFIDDLLDLTRISRGKLELQCAPLDVHETVRQALEIVSLEFEAKKQRFTVELTATAFGMVGDATRLQQVFWNLLKNASKFTPPGGEIRITSRTLEPAEPNAPKRIAVAVADTGIGFAREAGERIFEAFAQAGQEITREFGGLGLGLAISKASVDAHGGVIRAHSPGRGQGATFTVELPLAE